MDTVDAATRSRIMSSIGSKDTGPELALARALRAEGVTGWRRHRKILGIDADFSFGPERLVVRVNGCFWHGHKDDGCGPRAIPETNRCLWATKLRRNAERDVEQAARLRNAGWSVIDVWECRLRKPGPAGQAAAVQKRLEARRKGR